MYYRRTIWLYFKENDRLLWGKLDKKTVYVIAIDLLKHIKELHDSGFLHLDIKPSNILINLTTKIKYSKFSCVLNDFRFAQKYLNEQGEHIINKNSKIKGGNKYYSSAALLNHNCVGPKDDIISIIYILLELYAGNCPWSNISKEEHLSEKEIMIKMKKRFTFEEKYVEEIPEIVELYKYVNKLNFKERPDYEFYIELFEKALIKIKNTIKGFYRTKWEKNLYRKIKIALKKKNSEIFEEIIRKYFQRYPNEYIGYVLYDYYWSRDKKKEKNKICLI